MTLLDEADKPHGSPQYYEIYKYKEVIGISILFMVVDMSGGVFSDLSLAFKDSFDVVAGISYSLVVVSPWHQLLPFLQRSDMTHFDTPACRSWMELCCCARSY